MRSTKIIERKFSFPHATKMWGTLNKIYDTRRKMWDSLFGPPSVLDLEKPFVVFCPFIPEIANGLYTSEAQGRFCPKHLQTAGAETASAEFSKMIGSALVAYLKKINKELEDSVREFGAENMLVSVSTPEGYFQTKNPIFETDFLEMMEGFELECKELPEWLHFHFGTMAVMPDKRIPYDRFPQDVQELHQTNIHGGVKLLIPENFSKKYGDNRPKMMNTAVFGGCGPKNSVSFYTKRFIFHSDPHVRTHEQVVAKNRPSIAISYIDSHPIVKQHVICGDYNPEIQCLALGSFFALNPIFRSEGLPDRGLVDVVSHGKTVTPSASFYDLVSVNDSRFRNQVGFLGKGLL